MTKVTTLQNFAGVTDVTVQKAKTGYNRIMSRSNALDNAVTPETRRAAAGAGHWVLASAGKRVLRPGGVALTNELLRELNIKSGDTVVELAPGLGHTAEKVLSIKPATYLGVDSDPVAVSNLADRLGRDGVRFVQGSAEDTGLPGETATVLFGEAMLSMQSDLRRRQIVEEAWRVVRCGGRYGIHELCVAPGLSPTDQLRMEAGLRHAVRHGVRLLTVQEWRELMESAGFCVTFQSTAPMRLLDAGRILQDEGIAGAMRFAWNTLTHPAVFRRVLEMRRIFKRYQHNLQAVAMVCNKEY
jgi:SAM-dependent methyltransferase